MQASSNFNPISKQLVKWFIKVAWPWFLKNIWPDIKKDVIKAFGRIGAAAQSRVENWLRNRYQAKSDAAQQKAEQAESEAQTVCSEVEAERLRAVAAVWRQVAEEFRTENEELRSRLDEIAQHASSDFEAAMDELDIENLVEEGQDSSLRLRGSNAELKLPAPASDIE